MTDLPPFRVSRRTVLQGGVWAVPVIAAAVAAPAQTTSPPTAPAAQAVPDWYGSFRALTIQSADPGEPLPAGAYVFTTSSGVVPSASVFRTVPALAANTIPATGQQTTATVTLAQGSTLLGFTVYIRTTGLPATVDPSATLTVTLPTGGGATISILEERQSAFVYGPTGGHWPSNTPRLNAVFAYDVEVAPTWTAIAAAILAAPASGNARVRVQPGTLPVGMGSGSPSTPVLASGVASRGSKILVVPRDGWGTVKGNPSSTVTSKGYSFILGSVALLGFDFSGQGVMMRGQNAAIGWSTFGVLNVTANDPLGDVVGLELVECVLPDSLALESDRMAFRIADGQLIDGITMSGCYAAPAYRASASQVHTDTLQTSRSNGTTRVRNLAFVDSVFFHSSSQTLQFQFTDNVAISRSAFIGGLRGTGRYPIAADRYRMTAENTLWGGSDGASNVVLADSFVLGSINSGWKFASISNTVASEPLAPGVSVAQGGVTVDSQYASQSTPLPSSWYDTWCPMPSPSRLAQVWAALR